MLDLHHIKTNDKELVLGFMPDCCRQLCDFSFGNLYTWSAAEHTELAVCDSFLFLRSTFNGVTSYAFPWGKGDISKALQTIVDDARERESDLSFYCVTEEQLPYLEKFFGNRLVVREQRDYFDYIYLSENLSLLKGRKLHSKKNHVNSFMKKFTYTVEDITEDNLKECLEFSHRWHMQNESTQQLEAERQVIDCAFSKFGKLNYRGIIIRVGGDIVAYALGEPMADGKTFCVHFEKASPDFPQAYAAVNKLFADRLTGEFIYINREDDAGVEGLRKAKLSYQPEYLLKKYYAKVI